MQHPEHFLENGLGGSAQTVAVERSGTALPVILSFPIMKFNFLWLWLLQAGHILCVLFCCFFFVVVCLFIKTWSLVAQAGLELTKMTLNS